MVCCCRHPSLTFPSRMLWPTHVLHSDLFLMKEVCGWTLNTILIIDVLVNWTHRNTILHNVSALGHPSVPVPFVILHRRLSSCAPLGLPFFSWTTYPNSRISALASLSNWVLTESKEKLNRFWEDWRCPGNCVGSSCSKWLNRSFISSAQESPGKALVGGCLSSFSNSSNKNSSVSRR